MRKATYHTIRMVRTEQMARLIVRAVQRDSDDRNQWANGAICVEFTPETCAGVLYYHVYTLGAWHKSAVVRAQHVAKGVDYGMQALLAGLLPPVIVPLTEGEQG